jgi:hypothetical protein
MATCFPGNAFVEAMFQRRREPANARRLQQLYDQGEALDMEDYRTVGTDRGPVRGFVGGSRRL